MKRYDLILAMMMILKEHHSHRKGDKFDCASCRFRYGLDKYNLQEECGIPHIIKRNDELLINHDPDADEQESIFEYFL